MRVAIITGGSRGDVQPHVALGMGLVAAGHEVKVAAYPPFEDLVRSRGLDYAHLSGDPERIIQNLGKGRRNSWSFARALANELERFVGANVEECLWACRGADVVVYTPLGFVGLYVAQKLGVPTVGAVMQPTFSATAEFPSVTAPEPYLLPGTRLKGAYNRLSFYLTEASFTLIFKSLVDRVTNELRLRHVPLFPGAVQQARQRRDLTLCAWSPKVLPRPRDWAPYECVTGYWFLDRFQGWRPPSYLEDFLQSGPPPVCVGFGSMIPDDPERMTNMVVSALRSVGQRGLLVSGWSRMGATHSSDDMLRIEEAPHDWLFSRVRAVVHHGGSGTTAAALRAGVPSVVVPFLADQTFWGRRIARLGAGTPPIPAPHLSERALAGALRRVDGDVHMRERAADLGEQIHAEKGIEGAVSLVEQYVHGRGGPW